MDAPSVPVSGAVAQRGNHRWMLVVCLTPLVIVAAAAVVSFAGPSEPSVAVSVPAGYHAITDAYFGYAVPKTWSEDDAATTDTGTYYYEGPTGWAGETLGQRNTPPVLGSPGPSALGVFGSSEAVPYQLSGERATVVPGATTAWTYQLVRGGIATATVVDAWDASTSTELWLAVHADPATTAAVLASLRG